MIRFAPPRSPDVLAGPTPFAIRVASSENPAGSIAEEGSITVGRFEQRTLELFPPTTRGRRHSRLEAVTDNTGNAPIDVALAGVDAENACWYRFNPDVMRIAPESR